jgi:hypothetical protein
LLFSQRVRRQGAAVRCRHALASARQVRSPSLLDTALRFI